VQTCPRTEIVIIDNGSTDETARLIPYAGPVKAEFGANRGANARYNFDDVRESSGERSVTLHHGNETSRMTAEEISRK
jgi:hypothetical protein